MCVAVTCHLHFGQNVQDLLHATAVTQTLLVSRSPSAVADRQAKGKLDSILLLPCLKRAEALSQFFLLIDLLCISVYQGLRSL